MHFCCCQNKYNMCRRLFQSLQKCIKSTYGKHVYFVDNIYTILCHCRCKTRFFPQHTNIINTVVAGSIYFHYICDRTFINTATNFACTARFSIYRIQTVNGLSQYFRTRCFACTARTGKQISMCNSP